MADDTIFDKIIRGEIPADIVYEDEAVLAFRDINPQAPVHVVVIPKKKITGFDKISEFSADFAGRYMSGVAAAAAKLGLKDGYRVVFNNGKDGQQTVEYIHAHILGGRQLGWPPG
ncbi:MAG: histidine triad nucleotide-binding protein [Spirochaetales bacterium]|nr:histidine triad nucleotide-binding protein [Spirochaetales bacterium]